MRLPAPMQVFERGWLSSNSVLFADINGTALVDSGYASHAPQTVALVRHALQGRRLDRLFNTHLHSDHCGGNAELQRAYACHTAIPAAEADKVRDWNEDRLPFRAVGQRCERFTIDATLAPDDIVELGGMTWQVLAAPGHDPHSLIFYCADDGILISADALWENGFGVVFPELHGESGFAEVRATLDLIDSLDVKIVIPGHGSPFTDIGKALDTAYSRLDYFIAHPARNAQNAIKVLLKFMLLEKQSMSLEQVQAVLPNLPVVDEANCRYLNLSAPELVQSVVSQLVRAGAAEVVEGAVHNRD